MALPYVDHDKAYTKAAEQAIRKSLKRVAEEENWSIIDTPRISIEEAKVGFTFSADISLLPEVTLPKNVREIATNLNQAFSQKKEILTASDSEVQEAVTWLLSNREDLPKDQEGKPIHELTDEIAKTIGEFETAADVRKSIKEGLVAEKTVREANKNRAAILQKIVDLSTMDIPSVMIDRMVEGMRHDLLHSLNHDEAVFNEYLTKQNDY